MKTATRKSKVLSIVLVLVLCLSVLSIGSLSASAAGLTVWVSTTEELVEAVAAPNVNKIVLMNEMWLPYEGITIDRDIVFSALPGTEAILYTSTYGNVIDFYGEKLTVEFDRVSIYGDDAAGFWNGTIYSYAEDLTLINPDIRHFKAYSEGSITAYGKITIVGGSLTDIYNGAAVWGEHVVLAGGTVIRNVGGVGVSGDVIEIINAEISGCSSSGVVGYDTVIMTGGTIRNNQTWGNGGGIYGESGSSIIINGGLITGNSAQGYGGGIYAGGSLQVNGGTITGNFAPFGSDVWIA